MKMKEAKYKSPTSDALSMRSRTWSPGRQPTRQPTQELNKQLTHYTDTAQIAIFH